MWEIVSWVASANCHTTANSISAKIAAEAINGTVVIAASDTPLGKNTACPTETVAAPIEQELNGVKNMIYMYSTATSQGYLTIGAVFDIGTDPDQATIDVNNKVQMATPKLPSEVTKQGVTVQEKSNSILQVVTMRSTSSSPGVAV